MVDNAPTDTVLSSISIGGFHGCGIVASTNKLECWGASSYTGDASDHEIEYVPGTLMSGMGLVCAIKQSDDSLHCFGWNPPTETLPTDALLPSPCDASTTESSQSTPVVGRRLLEKHFDKISF